MHPIITSLPSISRPPRLAPASEPKFRQPAYDCREQAEAMELVVYLPGVGASGVEIEARGTDLTVTARKEHFVRVNWQTLHLEEFQRDYQLRLRLGHGFDYAAMAAEISQGVLTVRVPKRASAAPGLRRVA